jgi:type IV secretory pathway TrbD component
LAEREAGRLLDVLSQKEQEVLAAIESSLIEDDPALAARLSHGRRRLRLQLKRHGMLIGSVLVVTGALLVIITFAWSFWLATVGVALMIVGEFLLADPITRLVADCTRAWRKRARSRQPTL